MQHLILKSLIRAILVLASFFLVVPYLFFTSLTLVDNIGYRQVVIFSLPLVVFYLLVFYILFKNKGSHWLWNWLWKGSGVIFILALQYFANWSLSQNPDDLFGLFIFYILFPITGPVFFVGAFVKGLKSPKTLVAWVLAVALLIFLLISFAGRKNFLLKFAFEVNTPRNVAKQYQELEEGRRGALVLEACIKRRQTFYRITDTYYADDTEVIRLGIAYDSQGKELGRVEDNQILDGKSTKVHVPDVSPASCKTIHYRFAPGVTSEFPT